MLLPYLIFALLYATVLAPDRARPAAAYLVTELAEHDTYNLTVRLDDDRGADLLACLEKLTDQELSVSGTETISAEKDGVNLTYLSRRNMLVLSTVAPSPASADRARRIGKELKQELAIRSVGTTNDY